MSLAPISETFEAGGVNAMLPSSSSSTAVVRGSFLSVLSVTSSEVNSGTNSPRSQHTFPDNRSLGSSVTTPTSRTADQLYGKGNAALKVNPYRVSARAKIRWEKVKMYLGTIVQMGLESKTKSYDVLGTAFPGDMFGYSECSKRVTFKCSLVALEPCSYCTLSVDVILAIAKEVSIPSFSIFHLPFLPTSCFYSLPQFPGIGMEIQGALGSCIAETESKLHHDQWKKQKIDFLESVRKNLLAEEEQLLERRQLDRQMSTISATMGSMLKPINLARFSQVITLPQP